jgi:hypothetical protein
MSLENKSQILISYMAEVGRVLDKKKDKDHDFAELYAYFFGKVPRNAMLRNAIDAAIKQPNGDIDYDVLKVEMHNKSLLKVVIGNMAVIYNKNKGKNMKKSRRSSSLRTSSSSRASSRSYMVRSTHMPMHMPMNMPMPMPMNMPKINYRGKKHDPDGEGVELVALNSLGRVPKGITSRSTRRSRTTTSSTGIELVELNKGRKGKTRRTTSSKSNVKTSSGRVKNQAHDQAISLTETDASRPTPTDTRSSLYVYNTPTTSSSPFKELSSSGRSSKKGG